MEEGWDTKKIISGNITLKITFKTSAPRKKPYANECTGEILSCKK